MSVTNVAHRDLVARAESFVVGLRERAAEIEDQRRVPDDVMDDLRAAGLLRLQQPGRFGGHEAGFDVVGDVFFELGRGDASTAWVAMVLNSGAVVGAFPLGAQEQVWGHDPDALVGGVFAPARTVVNVDGGWQIGGEWAFGSGVDHASWMFLGGLTFPEEGPPDMRFFLVPRSDLDVVDDWHVVGLRGTGSKTLVARDLFVPRERTCSLALLREGEAPGRDVNPAPIYRMPLAAGYHGGLATVVAGVAQGAVEQYVDWTRDRVAHGVVKLAERQSVQVRLAESAAEVDAAMAVLRSDLTEATQIATEVEAAFTLEDRARYHRNAAMACQLCVRAVDRLFEQSGGRGLYGSHPVQRAWRDVRAAQAHISNRYDDAMEHWGRMAFGLGPANPFFY